MGRRHKIFLLWVFFLVAVALGCFGSKGSLPYFVRKISRSLNILPVTWRLSTSESSTPGFRMRAHASRMPATFVLHLNGRAEQGSAPSPTSVMTSDITHKDHGAPVATPPVEPAMLSPPIKSVDPKGSAPETSTAPHEFDVPLGTPSPSCQASEGTPHAPAPQESQKPVVNAFVSPQPPEVSHSPVTVEALRPPNGATPSMSHALPPEESQAPDPSEVKKPPNTAFSAPISSPRPLEASHAPTPDTVETPSNATAAAPSLSPQPSHNAARDNAKSPSNKTLEAPLSSPQPPAAASPSLDDAASPPKPMTEAPASSPPEASETPLNATPNSSPQPPESYHSPAPGEASNDPSTTASTPISSPAPSESSRSPVPGEARNPPNTTTSAPISSPPPSEPSHSPVPRETKNPPNTTASSPTSLPQPPETSHVPAPEEARNPPNVTVGPTISPGEPPVHSSSPSPKESQRHSNKIVPPISGSKPPQGSMSHSPTSSPGVPTQHTPPKTSQTPSPLPSPSLPSRARRFHESPSSAPTIPPKYQGTRNGTGYPAAAPSSPTPASSREAGTNFSPPPVSSPEALPKNNQRHASPHAQGPSISPSQSPFSSNATVGPTISPGETPVHSSTPSPKESKRHSNEIAPPVSGSNPPEGSMSQSPASSSGVPTQHTPPKTSKTPSPLPSPPPLPSRARRFHESPSSAPTILPKYQGTRNGTGNPAAAPSSPTPASSHNPGTKLSPPPVPSPEPLPKNNQKHISPHAQGPSISPSQSPFSSNDSEVVPSPAPSQVIPPRKNDGSPPALSPSASFFKNPGAPTPQPSQGFQLSPPHLEPAHSPVHFPSGHLPRNPGTPSPQPRPIFPPPPPTDCISLVCTIPFTNTPPGAPCACVQPMKVGLRLGIELYKFFPLVSELAQEVASGVSLKQSQVRIMGANAASEDPEKTVVLLDIVPFGYKFGKDIAFSVYDKFWNKEVPIKAPYFGDYDVLYVTYPGLPPSPPSAPIDFSAGNGIFGNTNNGRALKPLGVDVPKKKGKLSGSMIAMIILSSIVALILIAGTLWLLLLRHGGRSHLPSPTPESLSPSMAKSSAAGIPGIHSSTSASFASSIATYTGSLKTFSLSVIEMATDRFHDSKVIGEGGFGRVFQGTLEDGSKVAVKVLKRDDQQGGREFLAEVEMLSRLHHRNLVKLVGICTEAIRCLVYELVPNGSVESHLHGVDKETSPLDWNARTKIALGAARGLAYLHEDSSPRVIHRDFKSSNILLEHDFTPKVSDFGLARTALDEGNEHISTRVMGTFGYVAPEYAMTGHLLVKSDVYSYGVVLLELLTGRKPVDMLQPPGQENLVAWARPLLTSKEGLEGIIDPALGKNYPFEDAAKVAAIASMCVQPEVSHRPFMGEVVQALKLVCNEGDETKGSGSCSQDYSSAQDTETRTSAGFGFHSERMLSSSDVFSASARFTRDTSSSLLRHSSSGPLTSSRFGTIGRDQGACQ